MDDEKMDYRWKELDRVRDQQRHFVVGQRASKEDLAEALSIALAAMLNMKQFTTRYCTECMHNRKFADRTREEILKLLPSEEENLQDLRMKRNK